MRIESNMEEDDWERWIGKDERRGKKGDDLETAREGEKEIELKGGERGEES